jgi:hypothetical protein
MLRLLSFVRTARIIFADFATNGSIEAEIVLVIPPNRCQVLTRDLKTRAYVLTRIFRNGDVPRESGGRNYCSLHEDVQKHPRKARNNRIAGAPAAAHITILCIFYEMNSPISLLTERG